MRKFFVLVLLMTIFIGPKTRAALKNIYVVTASSHWELVSAANVYGARLINDGNRRFHLDITEHQRMKGIALEGHVPTPNPRLDPMNYAPNRSGGTGGRAWALYGWNVSPGDRSAVLGPPTYTVVIEDREKERVQQEGSTEIRLIGHPR